MASTKTRSFAKAFTWELGIFILQTLFFWWYLDNLYESFMLNVVITLVKAILLFLYERAWKKIGWGKF